MLQVYQRIFQGYHLQHEWLLIGADDKDSAVTILPETDNSLFVEMPVLSFAIIEKNYSFSSR